MTGVQLNTLSKHGIVIAAAAIAIFIVTCCDKVMALTSIEETDNQNYDDQITYLLKIGGLLAMCLLGITLSTLFISGIVKKRETFMAPWVVCLSIGTLGACFYAIYDVITNGFDEMVLIFFDTAGICVACIVLYPVCMLYLEVRNLNMRRKQEMRHLHLSTQIETESNDN